MTRRPGGRAAERWAGPVLVAALVVLGWFDLTQHYDTGAGLALMSSLLRAVPILWCRHWPLAAWGVVFAACVATALGTTPVSSAEPWPWAVTSVACLLAALAVAGWRLSLRMTLVLWGVFAVATVALSAGSDKGDLWGSLFTAAGAGLVVGALEALRRDRATRELLVEQEGISEAERTRRALLEERARIGRELHDVVAHHMSLIAVQAETAPYRLPEQSEDTKAEFRAISAAAREALTDMRKLLGLLRGDSTAADKAPQPSLSDITTLVESDPSATLAVSGDPAGVPTIIGVTAYRIVQESLSNARRHAPGAAVAVLLARSPRDVRLEIRNERAVGAPAGAGPSPSADGLGLAGMRERVGLLDGEFSAGPTADGGYAVSAVLPLRS
jgi:signal transduction histidine kinase